MSINKRIYLSAPHMSGQEIKYIEDAIDSNWVAPVGPDLYAFEKELADYLDVRGALALSSGTAAMHLALLLAGVGRDDQVFCSALTFAASANPILYQAGKPVFIDSDPESWNICPKALKRAFSDAKRANLMPKAVIVVNLYGQCAEMDSITRLCEEYHVTMIEDAAESIGALYKNKPSGSFGKYGVLSFNGNKIITTSGGGALVSNDLEAIERARFLANQARMPEIHYEHREVGYNYRMSNILAAIGRAQLEVLQDRVETRRKIYEHYYGALHDIDGLNFMPESQYCRATRWLTALTVDPVRCRADKNFIIKALAKNNIESRPVWKPMQLQPLYAGYPYYEHSAGNSISEKLFHNGICLPSGSNLKEHELNRVINVIKNYLA